jgi:hypothetical protein
MQVSFSASGTPQHVKDSIHSQARTARIANPDAGAQVYALRDGVQKHLEDAGENDLVSVTAVMSITVTRSPAKTPAPAELAPDPVEEE